MDRYYLIIVKAESAPKAVQPLAKGRQNVDKYEQNLSEPVRDVKLRRKFNF